FDKEIEQLVNEYELKAGRKRYALEEVWGKCEKFHDSTKQWYDEGFEEEELWENRIEEIDYTPPLAKKETFEVHRYTFKNGKSFLYEEIGIRSLLDSYSCGSKVLSWRNHLELADAAGSTNLRDQMYVLFQRAVWEEEDCRRVLPSQISEVNKRLSKLEAYIVDIKVLGLRLLAVEPLGYMI
ncbi:hypothetical protein Tco_0617593, partial [Tanacetum coccineum]